MSNLRVLKIIVQPVFVTENEDGELMEQVADARAMTVTQLREFANGGLEESIKATETQLQEKA